MSAVEELELALPAGRLAARRFGRAGAESVLALHGWLDNAASFDALAPLLPEVDLVALDLPGHGRSAHKPPGAWYHYVDYFDAVLQAADALGFRRFTLLGHSLGGAIGSVLAAIAPERVAALWLIEALGPISTHPSRTRESLARAVSERRALAAKALRVFPDLDAAIRARMRGDLLPLSEPAARSIVGRGVRAVEGGYVWASDQRLTLASAIRLTEEQVLDCLAGIACPTLLIVADPPAPYVQLEAMQKRIACVPGLVLERLAGSHHLHLEHAATVAAAIAAFRGRGR
jgi:pimeloyl-ACP methyl ester carboxylesterase